MKSVETLIQEIALDEADGILALGNYRTNGHITTHNEGFYEDLKEALIQEGHVVVNTAYRNELYHIFVTERKHS